MADNKDVHDANDETDAFADEVTKPLATTTELAKIEPRDVATVDPFRSYLAEIRRFAPLTEEEERDLAIRYREGGDLKAAYRLVTSHLRLVVRIAFEFKRTWQNLLDLIQEGNVGLLLAVQKFDPYRGIRLSTYATWWIRAYVIKFLLDNWRMVKVGTTNARRKLLFNLRKEKEALMAQGIEPGPKLLAERLNVSEQDVIEVDRSLGKPDVSLETPLGTDSDQRLVDTLPSAEVPVDEQVALKQRREIIEAKLEGFARDLPERESAVFRERLLAEEPATLQELGDRFGMTREGLRQVEKRLLARLKEYLLRELDDLADLGLTPPPDDQRARALAPTRALPAPDSTSENRNEKRRKPKTAR